MDRILVYVSGLYPFSIIEKKRQVERGMITMLNKKTVDDLTNLQGKKVLVRCDFNVPLKDGVIQNYNRIDGAIPTIKKLLDQGARVILCSHLGKPKGEPVPEMSLAPVAPALKERLGVEQTCGILGTAPAYLWSVRVVPPSAGQVM